MCSGLPRLRSGSDILFDNSNTLSIFLFPIFIFVEHVIGVLISHNCRYLVKKYSTNK